MREAIGYWLARIDTRAWRRFGTAIAALMIALLLALYSGAAAEMGHLWLAALSASVALALAAWVGITIVPTLARRTSLRSLLYQIDYKVTREGILYLAIVFVLALAALNTGNNLIFLILSCMLAGILVSGVLSRVSLTGISLKLLLPEHLFAGKPTLTTVTLENEKLSVPSFSLRVSSARGNGPADADVFGRPVYFPYLPRQSSVARRVELVFPHRGRWRQDAFAVSSKFPFGFLEKVRKVEMPLELIVYPPIEPTAEYFEVLPLISGEMESFHRGRGHDLHSIRDYRPTDSARHVDWKATARAQQLKVREFAREDERKLELIFDPYIVSKNDPETAARQFEKAVTLCASLAWHYFEIAAEMRFRTPTFESPMAPAAAIIYDCLRELALMEPQKVETTPLFDDLIHERDTYKIVFTGRPRGTIPPAVWSFSYLIFMETL